jgi:hypothetical protein
VGDYQDTEGLTMPLVLKDRVKETTTTTGTGTVSLAGAVAGFDSFSVIGDANTTYYAIVAQTPGEWEVGIGTYTSSGTTLSRDSILASSNSGSAVNFSAGTKDVFVTYPAGKAFTTDDAARAAVSTTPPSNPSQGELWWDDVDGNLYIYYEDGTSNQWVPATVGIAAGAVDTTTTKASTSGTTVDFTDIPVWAKKVTILFSGVSTSGSSDVIVQIGTSGGYINSGYVGSAITVVGGASPGASAYSSGFLIRMGGGASAAAVRVGIVELQNVFDNTWVGDVSIGLTNTVYWAGGSGQLNAAAVLNSVRITTVNGTDTFDAGSISVRYA